MSERRLKTAKCSIVRCVLDLGHTAKNRAHGNLFLFSISNYSLKKKHNTTTTLTCAKYMAHGKPYFFPSINSTNLISKHVNLTKYTLQSIIKLTKHITRSAYFKILYFSMHVYFNLNISTLIVIILKKFKKWQTNLENYHD